MKTVTARTYWNIHKPSGYNQCNLVVDGKKVARCNGGGYDMVGTVFGHWIARTFGELLRRKIKKPFYGLSFHDPDFDPGKAEVPGTGQTVEQREAAGESLGLERYQAFYRASSDLPTKRHTVARLDGACGRSGMFSVFEAIGGKIKYLREGRRETTHYEITLPD